MIVIVRDGRSVVESGVKTFGWHYETAIRAWDDEVKKIIQFKKKLNRKGLDHKLLIVKFEDLFSNTKIEMEKVFSFLGVSVKEYDFSAAENLPVSGSSTLAEKGVEKVNWDLKIKGKDFNPLERYQFWSRVKHERFNWLVNDDSLAYFGYQKKKFDTYQHFWIFWNIFIDRFWKVRIYLQLLKKLISRKNLKFISLF